MVEFSRLRFVILDCPYLLSQDSQARDLFSRMVRLKYEGYSAHYGTGSLPLDTTDFIGTHHLICEEREGELHPVLGYKTVSLERCQLFNNPFPALSLAITSKATSHAAKVTEIILASEAKNRGLFYGGGWTMAPHAQADRESAKDLKDRMAAMLTTYHLREAQGEELCLGVLRFKTERYFSKIGYEPLRDAEGEILPTFHLRSLLGEEVQMLHCRNFSLEARQLAKNHEILWNQRLQLAPAQLNSFTQTRKVA
ncbi:MAG: hypothetical protein H7222_18150 [Methylotenera sp.]|nr:hypothetical protein [Oligoflexia bacterium]